MAPGSLCLQARALSALSAKAVVGKPFANQPVGRHPVLLVTRRCVVSVPICCEIQGLHTLPPARGPWVPHLWGQVGLAEGTVACLGLIRIQVDLHVCCLVESLRSRESRDRPLGLAPPRPTRGAHTHLSWPHGAHRG